MKYHNLEQPIPQNARQDLNNKILYLVDHDLAEQSGISREDIYNAYTGDGGLHGLTFSSFDNYHAYSEAKKEIENGQFFTPHTVCQFMVDCLDLSATDTVADLTCGMGTFFNFLPTESCAYGCELDVKAFKVARYLYPKANLINGDIRSYAPGVKFDYVVGNPPFNLRWWVDGAQILSQLYYCQKAAELLKPLGIMAILVPKSFLADDFSDGGLIREMEQRFSFLGQFSLPQDCFAAFGVKGYETNVQFWQKKTDLSGWTPNPYTTDVLDTVSLDRHGLSYVKSVLLNEAQETFRKNRSHILLELARHGDENTEFVYKVKKYLYAIQSHPALRDGYVKCCDYLSRFYNQKQPDGMSYEEWMRVRLTEAKVLAYLRRTLSKQHPVQYRDEIRMVKRDHDIGFKAYSPKMARQLTDGGKCGTPVFQIVSRNLDEEQFKPYARMLRRRKRRYDAEQKKLCDMQEDSEIAQWLRDFSLYDDVNEEMIRLNDLQRHDINLVLQKQYMLLQWEQGSGKTLAGIATGMYRMQRQGAFCTWVISPAISIKNNWNEVLPNYGIHYVMVERLADLDKIQRGDFVIITMNMLCKYRKQIKSWIRQHGQKIALCFDESDEMSNPSSVRTKAVLDVFRRCKFKLLMTGTSTRNNISEFAPQLELAYNNSENMISWASTEFVYEKDDNGEKVLTTKSNPYYGMPIPAYKKGYSLFSGCHLPEKVTVFGIGKRTQDIYNADALNEILGRFVITRSFKEVSGKDIVNLHQVPVIFSEAEREVYQQAITEFERMRGNYFASTGNSRKDSMMKLIQQITLLLRIAAAPNTVAEYRGDTPVKIAKVLSMLQQLDGQIVAIGVRHKQVVDAYAAAIRNVMPDRPLFVVTGSTTTLAKRRALRKTLKESGNGILLCTQQSLPSSVNFEFVDHVIIPELHYNNSRMSQFYFRFIRYNSVNQKHVYFVTYLGSIESNQMQMVLAKEKINLFMKGEDTNLDEIYDKFGVDYDLLSALMSREADEEGKFQIRWGEQLIS